MSATVDPLPGMKTLGLIGGMSWESTAEYYRLANQLVAERAGGLHSCSCLLSSVDFAVIEGLQVRGRWDEAATLLGQEARRLEAAGAQVLLLCTNTMHIVADAVQAAVDVPLLNIVDVVAESARSARFQTLGIIGTKYTMQAPFYRERLERRGLATLVPPAIDQNMVHRVIYEELCRGLISGESRQRYREVIGRLRDAGADAVVLACTEIELLVSQADTAVPLLPSTALHVEAAVEWAWEPDHRG
jgi:aspartate racemase